MRARDGNAPRFDHDAAIRMYREGMYLNAIAEHFGVSRERIRQIVHNAGLPVRPRGGVAGGKRPRKGKD